MAFTVDRDDMATAIRDLGEITTTYVTDANLLSMMNRSMASLHRLIVKQNADFYRSTDLITVVSGTAEYALPADFYLARGCDIQLNNEWRNIKPFNWGERNRLQNLGGAKEWMRYRIHGGYLVLAPTPEFSGTDIVQLHYVPTATQFDGPIDDSTDETWDAINGADDWVIYDVIIDFANKEESDPAAWMAKQAKVQAEILSVITERDIGEPDRVRDVYAEESEDAYFPDYWRP